MSSGGKRGGSSTVSMCSGALLCIEASLVVRGVAVVGVWVPFILEVRISGVMKQRVMSLDAERYSAVTSYEQGMAY